jgi:hypothetical protein
MKRRILRWLAACVALGVAATAAIRIGARRQERALSGQIGQLVRAAATVEPPRAVGDVAVESLPPPVARYLRWALPHETRIRAVHIEQVGMLRTDARSDRWMAFEAQQTAVPLGIGFLWNARVIIAPLLHVTVRDGYLDGEGFGQVSLLSPRTVSSAGATPEMNSGSLHRFLAEAVWYPTALLPSSHLRWSAIDEPGDSHAD